MKFFKKHLKVIVFLIVCLLIYYIYINNNKTRINYISLGDGFAVGINSYNQKSYGYNNYLSDYLKKTKRLNKYYNNFSYKDMEVKDLKKDLLINVGDKNKNNLKEALRESQILTLSIGLNDLIYQIDTSSNMNSKEEDKIINNILKELSTSIVEIKKYFKGDLYLIGYYNFYPQKTVQKRMLDKLNCGYKKISKKYQLIYINNSNINLNLDKYLDNPGSIYPNTLGYKAIFDNILVKIK